ncbi:MAG: Na(+)/H(+) antiporter subunit D [Candidatus Omnitrophica bacterium]|nr:Na(+)/H(+) antiporter subunit D [Candidatus Omnitrophota bacterium]
MTLHPALPLLLGAVFLWVLPPKLRPWLSVLAGALALWMITGLGAESSLSLNLMSFNLQLLAVDKLSRVFGFIFALITALGSVYALHNKDAKEQTAVLLYAAGTQIVCFAGDLLTLYAGWEVMAVTAATLVWLRRNPESLAAGLRYLLMHLFGGTVMLAGILLHWNATGSLAFVGAHFSGLSGGMILFGFLLNAAVPPLGAWLPDAYPQATVTGTVFLSAFTTKAGVYCLARAFPGTELLLWLGVMMALYGVVFAVLENDIRRLLGYHIISQVGYMVAGVGLGTEMAINGATAHAFCHILYKALLLMGAGTVLYSTGKSKLTELGGLYNRMRLAFWLYMIGAFSISGFPLFNGFISKSMVVAAAHHEHHYWMFYGLQLASVGTFLSIGLKLPWFAWAGKSLSPLEVKPLPQNMVWGMGAVAALCFVSGVMPALLYPHLPYAVHYQPYTAHHLAEMMQILIFTAAGFFLLLKKLKIQDTLTVDTDWFYRKPGLAAASALVGGVNAVFSKSLQALLNAAHAIVLPVWNPDENRMSLQNSGMLLILFLVVLGILCL